MSEYDDWKTGVHIPHEDDPTWCATCANEDALTHISPYGELICTICAESGDWEADGLTRPQPIR